MPSSRRVSEALIAGCLSLLFVSTALAAGPATVTVRVEGVTETKLPLTLLTTTTEPVVKGGEGSCSGTSALGALQLATGGNWSGAWSAGYHGYFIEAIEGEGEAVGSSKYYWSFWVNDRYQEEGACAVELEPGDRVLFFPICWEACPAGAEPTPLEVEAPATANVGEQVNVTVKQYNVKGEPSPAAGAHIASNGTSATTDSQGHATLTFATRGAYSLQVTGAESGPPAVRTETAVCVHAGNDGNCGTHVEVTAANPTGSSTSAGGGGVAGFTQARPYTGPFALVADATSLIDGHVYTHGHAPRELAGRILAHSAVSSVSLELRRRYRGRCYSYDGISERFHSSRCGRGSLFKVSSNGVFSYLLPATLGPGRYVLDVHATDAAGNQVTLARGTSRLVFYVR